jgi:hypothetical protein
MAPEAFPCKGNEDSLCTTDDVANFILGQTIPIKRIQYVIDGEVFDYFLCDGNQNVFERRFSPGLNLQPIVVDNQWIYEQILTLINQDVQILYL